MSSNIPKTPGLLAVAVSAGVMIGAAGVFIYEHFIKEKRRLILQQDLMTLGLSVSELRREVEDLRQAQLARRRARRTRSEELNSTGASISESEPDMMSLVDDDEFFDFSDSEDDSNKKQKKVESDKRLAAPASYTSGGSGNSSAKKPASALNIPDPVPAVDGRVSPSKCLKKVKKTVRMPDPQPTPSIEVIASPNKKAKNQTRVSGSLSSRSVRSSTRSAQILSGPRLTKLRALSREEKSCPEMGSDDLRSPSQATLSDTESQVSVVVEEMIERASRLENTLTVVSRGEWHDDLHDKRFMSIDKDISDNNLDVKGRGYDKLTALNQSCPNDAEVLWRLAKVCNGMATVKGLQDDPCGKKQCVEEAVQHATRALELAPRSAEVHKWYAISVGSRSEFQPVKLRIKDGFTFKDHIEEALKITPDDPTLLHLLGRFKFEVATLGWMERKIATSLFGEVPYATFPEALEPLLRVEILNKTPWMENRLIIAKCYIQMGENLKALEWLDNAYEIPCQALDDERVQLEVQQLLEKFEKYRVKGAKKKK